ncbi:uncharacterized protein [Musca autumnalis]|uniref:uncharacterized protein n=1 Tax=Musca autumnalis TaxID=221902 RepID=UPI003CF7B9B5
MMCSSKMHLNIMMIIMSLVVSAVFASATNTISYIVNINLSLRNNQWICGDIKCPSHTFGCRIQRYTNSDNNLLESTYTCFDENKVNIRSSVTDTIEMTDSRKIEIDIELYNGAKSVYTTTYRLGGHEYAQGIISPKGWYHFIARVKSNIKVIEEYNRLINTQLLEATASVGMRKK